MALVAVEIRRIAGGWVNMKALYDNGKRGRARKLHWWLSYNLKEQRFAGSGDFKRAIAGGHTDLLEAAKRTALEAGAS